MGWMRWFWGAAAGPSLPPCSCPTAESSGGAKGKHLLYNSCPKPGAFTRPLRGSVHSHVLTSTANSTGPIVLPSHHLLHERSQLRLSLVGEICSTNKTSALGLAVLLQRDPPALPPHNCSGGRGRGQRKQQQAGAPGAGTRRPACGKHLPAGATAKRHLVQQRERGLDPPAALPRPCPRRFAPWGDHPGTATARQPPALRLPRHHARSLLCHPHHWSDPPSFSRGSGHVSSTPGERPRRGFRQVLCSPGCREPLAGFPHGPSGPRSPLQQ